MKQKLLLLLSVFFYSYGQAQVSVYARFITYNNQVLKTDGSFGSGALIATTSVDPTSDELFRITTLTQETEQTLNIGSQSTGAGAGKATFNPVTFSRPVDAASPLFFQNMASGTPYRTVEIFFTEANGRIASRQLYKLAAIKSLNWVAASCTNDCPLVIENMSMEYGGLIVTVYKSGANYLTTPITKGWNRVKNVSDNDPNAVIN